MGEGVRWEGGGVEAHGEGPLGEGKEFIDSRGEPKGGSGEGMEGKIYFPKLLIN